MQDYAKTTPSIFTKFGAKVAWKKSLHFGGYTRGRVGLGICLTVAILQHQQPWWRYVLY